MATYKVKITFDPRKVAEQIPAPSANVCSVFEPNVSYIDSEDYEDTRYNSNVKGFGDIEQVEPYASTSVPMSTPLAQFKLATQAQKVDDTTGVRELTFDVEDYKEAFYYLQLGEDMKEQGFAVEVEGLGLQAKNTADSGAEASQG